MDFTFLLNAAASFNISFILLILSAVSAGTSFFLKEIELDHHPILYPQ
jgi:hypothetical protein